MATQTGERLMSLDVFRGATIAAMILVNNPGSWQAAYPPLLHAEWHGWTFTDTIFPSFLWIVGVALTLSFAKRVARGDSRGRLFLHVLRRSALIFLIGLFLGGFPYFNFETLRIPGVLQRIAICYLIASALYLWRGIRACVVAIPILLAGYWTLMTLVPVPGYGPGVLEKQGNFAQYIDSLLLSGHMWSQTKTWDPEGIVSTLPSIATTLFGVLAGWLLGRVDMTRERKAGVLALAGIAGIVAGQVMHLWLPINKNLWTSSFSVFMAGLSALVFAASYWLVDIKGFGRWLKPFAVYGMNAIVIYALSGLLARVVTLVHVLDENGRRMPMKTWLYEMLVGPFSAVNASLVFAVLNVLVLYVVAWFMHRRRWFVRL